MAKPSAPAKRTRHLRTRSGRSSGEVLTKSGCAIRRLVPAVSVIKRQDNFGQSTARVRSGGVERAPLPPIRSACLSAGGLNPVSSDAWDPREERKHQKGSYEID